MFHIDIQKGEEATKTYILKKIIIGNVVCMKRLMIATKVCGQLTSIHTYFYDIWFSGVKTSDEAIAEEVDF